MIEDPTPKKSFKEKTKETFDELASSETAQKIKDFTKDNKGETAAYILLLIGLLLTIGNPIWGGSIVGIVTGFYFYEEILNFFSTIKGTIKEEGLLKFTILAVLLVLFFIAYPLLFIAMAIVVAIMQIVTLSRKDRE